MCVTCRVSYYNAAVGETGGGIENPQRVMQGAPDVPFAFIGPFSDGQVDAMKWGVDRIGGSRPTR